MNFSLEIRRLATKEGKEYIVCFKHAIEACGKGYEIKEEVDEFGGECDCRRTSCEVCYKPWDVKKDIKL